MANVIRRVVIDGLYDNYNYDITLKEGITLITGPNGYGKTTLLNILKNALELNFSFFYELLFKSITLYFGETDKEPKLTINKRKEKQESLFDDDISYSVDIAFYQGNIQDSFSFRDSDVPHIIFSGEGDEEYNYREEYFPKRIIFNNRKKQEGMQELMQNFKNFQLFLNDKKCQFIKEQRIFSSNRNRLDNNDYTITQLAEDLKQRYAKQKSLYTDMSQTIDSSFVERLLGKSYKAYEENEYKVKINELERRVTDYKKFDLISNYSFVGQFDNEFKPALSLYIDDMFKKIGTYNDFYNKLSLFDSFVNGKVLSNKTMFLNEKYGFCFQSDSGRNIPLRKLSSGEQNLVILYYRLVFETDSNTLLLIDEPENSMHVEWLEKMLSDFFAMGKELKCQMIIATHSPIFIGGNFNVAYDLYGGSYQDWMKE